MFDSELPEDAAAAVAALQAAVDGLLGLELSRCTGGQVLMLLAQVETQLRRAPSFDQQAVAELEQRGFAREVAHCSTAALLRGRLRLSPSEASARVHAARDLGPRQGLVGEPLPRLFPAVAEAQRAGAISAAHAKVVIRTVTLLPAELEREHGPAVEATLVEHARRLPPDQLAAVARHLVALLDPDGDAPDEEDHRRQRDLRLARNRDGSGELHAHLTPEALAVWQTVLGALSAPVPAEDGQPDPRSPGQRGHDALLDAGHRLLRSGTLPDSGGVPLTLTVTMTLDQLTTGTGLARTEYGGQLSVSTLLRDAAEAGLIPVALGAGGEVLDYGRTQRLAPAGMRKALAARDKGCSFPGCERPPSWCQTHHVQAWIDDGPTATDNLTLLCGFHHREFDRLGWTCRMTGGVPEWTPPDWIDPHQRPRRNTSHHPELVFTLPAAPSALDNAHLEPAL